MIATRHYGPGPHLSVAGGVHLRSASLKPSPKHPAPTGTFSTAETPMVTGGRLGGRTFEAGHTPRDAQTNAARLVHLCEMR